MKTIKEMEKIFQKQQDRWGVSDENFEYLKQLEKAGKIKSIQKDKIVVNPFGSIQRSVRLVQRESESVDFHDNQKRKKTKLYRLIFE